MKVIEAMDTESGVMTEHHGEGFKSVLSQYTNQDVELSLSRYVEAESGIGHRFFSRVLIGNCKDGLTEEDYYTAYDKLL